MTPDEIRAMTPEARKAMFAEAEKRAAAVFPYECITVPGTEALREWRRLRSAEQRLPVFVSDKATLDHIVRQYNSEDPGIFPWLQESGRSVPEILEAAASLQLPADLKRLRRMSGYVVDLPPLGAMTTAPAEVTRIPFAIWDSASGGVLPEVFIILLPAAENYEIPAYLKWTGHNDCPPTEFHVAILKLWHDRFCAELIGLGRDYLDVFVRNPPTTLEDAIQMAKEEYFYYPAAIDDGRGTLLARAAELMESHWCFFWWD